MIEVIYKKTELTPPEAVAKDNKGREVKIPKNITQIGNGNSKSKVKIYIESQIVDYIRREHVDNTIRYGVLIGTFQGDSDEMGYEYVFARDCIDIPVGNENIILFNDDIWLKVYEELKNKKVQGEIVGWYASFGQGRSPQGLSGEHMRKLHLDNFAGINKILYCHEDQCEDRVYIYGDGVMERQETYYLYSGKCQNNKVKTAVKEENNKEASYSKYGGKGWGSVAVIIVLIGILGYMGGNGMLDSLTNRAKSTLSGQENRFPDIFQLEGDVTKENDIDVDGTISSKEENESGPTNDNITKENEEATTKKNEESTTKKNEEGTTRKNQETTARKDGENVENDNEEATKNKENPTGAVSMDDLGIIYVVGKGETLYDICRSYYNSLQMVKKVVEINNLDDPDKIYEGQKLILP